MTGKNTLYWQHYTDVQPSEWLWPNFSPNELASRGNGSLKVDIDAIHKLQVMRDIVGRPMTITSAYRDPRHNARVGGAPRSMHKQGRAFDIALRGHNKEQLKQAAEEAGFGGIAFARSFMHVDNGRKRTWEY